MYEEFYGLREKPFSILPDPSYLYMSKVHNRALMLLRYSLISGQGFTVLSGEIGSGKTTLINKLVDDLDEDIRVGVLSFTQVGSANIMEWVAMTFGLDYHGKSEAELYDIFLQFLISEYGAGRKVVLIVDEAQNMGMAGLEKLRMLSNVNARKDYLLHMILVGQPELRTPDQGAAAKAVIAADCRRLSPGCNDRLQRRSNTSSTGSRRPAAIRLYSAIRRYVC